tara:strand:- start:232 stop:804 length:573 start_codon:yes stop_codon:yes gene_type:complete
MSILEKIAKYQTDLDELERVEHFDPSPPGAIPNAKAVARRLKNMKEPKHKTQKERVKGQVQVGAYLGVPTGTLVGTLTEGSHPLSYARRVKQLKGPEHILTGEGGITAKKAVQKLNRRLLGLSAVGGLIGAGLLGLEGASKRGAQRHYNFVEDHRDFYKKTRNKKYRNKLAKDYVKYRTHIHNTLLRGNY